MTEDKEYDFEKLKTRTVEALKTSNLSIREFHYFKVTLEDASGNKTELGHYPICLVDEYKQFVEDNLPKGESNQ